jgi:hypothetical protein
MQWTSHFDPNRIHSRVATIMQSKDGALGSARKQTTYGPYAYMYAATIIQAVAWDKTQIDGAGLTFLASAAKMVLVLLATLKKRRLLGSALSLPMALARRAMPMPRQHGGGITGI